ncbi:hypothetical protein HPP92_028451, partial [Vanilla planifolia]
AYSRKTQWSISILSGFTRRGFSVGVSGGSSNSNEKNEVMPSITTKNEECDIAIVGGGMVGLALACGLSSMQLAKQLRVAIIDSNPAVKSRANFKKSEIVATFQAVIMTVFDISEVGAWEYVEQQRHAYFNQMQVWDYTGLGYTRYNARDVDKDYLGCVVENKVLCNSLLSSLQVLFCYIQSNYQFSFLCGNFICPIFHSDPAYRSFKLSICLDFSLPLKSWICYSIYFTTSLDGNLMWSVLIRFVYLKNGTLLPS